jgi:hypothetical protein
MLEAVKTNGKNPSQDAAEQRAQRGEGESHATRLAGLIRAYAPHDGTFDLRIPGLHVSRYSRINADCVHALQLPALCVCI